MYYQPEEGNNNNTSILQYCKLAIARSKWMASEYEPLRFFSSVCAKMVAGWLDAALEHGSKGTRYTQALLHALSQLEFSDRRCPLSNSTGRNCCNAENITAIEHFCNCPSISADVNTIITGA